MVYDYVPELVKIDKIWDESSDSKRFRVKMKMAHHPGQFVQVSVVGIGECPLGICSYSEDHIEFLVRKVGNVTTALHNLKVGDLIGVRGPYGHGYPMHYFDGDKIVIIGGGSGVAPLRSIIQYVEKNMDKFDGAELFLGYRSPSDILFKEDLKEWQKRFKVSMTVDKGDKRWKGNVGVVTKLIDSSGMDNNKKIVAACGPPIMMKFVIQSLKNLGFNDDQIYVSLERMMQCGIGKCGHCLVGGKYVCEHGPVFRYDSAKWLED